MANKFFTMVAVASVGFVALAGNTAWFNGGLGTASKISPSNGTWTVPSDGVTTNASNQLVLDDPETALSFAATNAKNPDGTNLTFATTANFKYSYEELPTVDADAKAGVVVYTNRFYVLGKDGDKSENVWKKTEVSLANLDSAVPISIVVTNGNSKVFATYTINSGTPFSTEVYVKSDAKSWGTVSYTGCGVVSALTGQYELLGYPIPGGGDPIPADKVNAWATEYYPGLTEQQVAAMLASSQTYTDGRTAAESCILGVATNQSVIAKVVDETAAKIKFAVQCNPIAGRVSFKLIKDNGATAVATADTASFEYDIGDGVYKIVADIDNNGKLLKVSQEIGVKGVEVVANKVKYIGAPWNDCPITNLFKKTCCSTGDKLEYYDANDKAYKSWILTGGNWSGTDEMVTLKKGQAVKYTPASGGTLYEVGDVSSVKTTALKTGETWNLIAPPNGEAIAAKDLPIVNDGEKIVVLGEDGVTSVKQYRNIDGDKAEWFGYNTKPYAVTNESASVSGGFFFQTKTQGSITWPESK